MTPIHSYEIRCPECGETFALSTTDFDRIVARLLSDGRKAPPSVNFICKQPCGMAFHFDYHRKPQNGLTKCLADQDLQERIVSLRCDDPNCPFPQVDLIAVRRSNYVWADLNAERLSWDLSAMRCECDHPATLDLTHVLRIL